MVNERVIPERVIQKQVKDWLELNGLEPLRNNTGKFVKKYRMKSGRTREHWIVCGREGSGDVIFCSMSGQWVELEIKSSTGQLRPEQKKRQKMIEQRGGLYLVIRCLDDLLRWKEVILGDGRD